MSFFGQYYACEVLSRCNQEVPLLCIALHCFAWLGERQDRLQDIFRSWMFQEEVRSSLGPMPVIWSDLKDAVERERQLLEAKIKEI